MSEQAQRISGAWVATERPVVASAFERCCRLAGVRYLSRPPEDPHDAGGEVAVLVDLGHEGDRPVVGSPGGVLLLSPVVMTGRLSEALRSSSDAVLTTADGFDEMVAGLEAVARGGAYVSPTAARLLLTWLRARGADGRHAEVVLSVREQDVLRAMVHGLTIKATARRLGVAVKTVEAHRRRLFDRLGVRTQTEAVTAALSNPSLLDGQHSSRAGLG